MVVEGGIKKENLLISQHLGLEKFTSDEATPNGFIIENNRVFRLDSSGLQPTPSGRPSKVVAVVVPLAQALAFAGVARTHVLDVVAPEGASLGNVALLPSDSPPVDDDADVVDIRRHESVTRRRAAVHQEAGAVAGRRPVDVGAVQPLARF